MLDKCGTVRTTVTFPAKLLQRSQNLVDSGQARELLIRAGSGGLAADSVALGGQVRAIAKTRLLRRRGCLPPDVMAQIEAWFIPGNMCFTNLARKRVIPSALLRTRSESLC